MSKICYTPWIWIRPSATN